MRRGGAASVFITKDRDFAELVTRLGPPPSIILLSCGNTSNVYLRTMLRDQLAAALSLREEGSRWLKSVTRSAASKSEHAQANRHGAD